MSILTASFRLWTLPWSRPRASVVTPLPITLPSTIVFSETASTLAAGTSTKTAISIAIAHVVFFIVDLLWSFMPK